MTDIEKQNLFFGFKKRDDSVFKSELSLDIIKSLDKANLPFKMITQFPKHEVTKLKESTRNYITSRFPGLNKEVLYMHPQGLELLLSNFSRFRPDSEYAIKQLREKSTSIDCFDIPISFNNYIDNCSVEQACLFAEDPTYLHRHPIINSEIRMSYALGSTLDATYLHEIVHTLTSRNKNTITDFYSDEVLNIFLELLNISETSTKEELLRSQMNRWTTFIEDLNLYKIISSGNDDLRKYYKGTIQAIRLLDIFNQLNSDEKVSFLAEVKKVLSGLNTLDIFLKKYGINGIDQGCVYSATKSIKLSEDFSRSVR